MTQAQPLHAVRTQHQTAYDIYIVGIGMLGQHQLTREVEAALRRCKEIFVLHYEPTLIKYFAEFCPNVIDLSSSYQQGAAREKIYETIGHRVLMAGQANPPVGLALYGHPVVFVSPTNVIVRQSEALGLRTKVLPGISAMDCLFVDLNLDPAADGLQMYEATDMLLRQRPVQPDVPCLIWQIGSVGNLRYSTEPNFLKPEYLTRLKDYLLRFYPGEHEAVIAVTPVIPIAKPKLLRVVLRELDKMYDRISSVDTLFIPPTHHRQVSDVEFLGMVSSESGPEEQNAQHCPQDA